MNRERKRELTSRLKKKGFTEEQIKAYLFLKTRDTYATKLQSGDKVQLDREAITKDPNWERKVAPYKTWCSEHFGEVFTTQVHKEERPDLWQLNEDCTEPKWLFHASELLLVKENPSSN